MFDGVHLGHQAVIETAVQSARATNGICGVLTFWPHPSRLFSPDDPVKMIMSPGMKAEVLASHKIDFIIQQPFDKEFASIEALDLVTYLKKVLPNLESIHVGSNWRFGKQAAGNVDLLVQMGRQAGVHIIHVERVNYDGEPISSTRVRKHLTHGEMEIANALLGEVYYSKSTVIEGKQLGEKVGFPTLNLPWSPDLKPPFGVYCVELEGYIGGSPVTEKAVANYGVRPTVENTDDPILEVHVLDFCPFTTGQNLKVRWFHFLRPEQKFENLEALRKQIAEDVEAARRFWR